MVKVVYKDFAFICTFLRFYWQQLASFHILLLKHGRTYALSFFKNPGKIGLFLESKHSAYFLDGVMAILK
jgi:hypothetical protein